jgi:glucose-6-phosphate 1-epimerase
MNSTTDTFQDFPGWRWALPSGDSVFVAQQGAHVMSWHSGGQERLYLSPHAAFDGQTAIRGGVPVCFPQFNQRGPLPKHGFARNVAWQIAPELSSAHEKVFQLNSDDQSLSIWPFAFKVQLKVSLQTDAIHMALSVQNTGQQALEFTGALHTYLSVSQITQVSLLGQAQQAEWDTVTDRHQRCSGHLQFESEFDRVYDVQTAVAEEMPYDLTPTWTLQDGVSSLQIAQSSSWGQSVVWNPGAAKCAQMADMPGSDYLNMLCVEAARVTSPIQVLPGQSWSGWQHLKHSPSC